MLRTIGLMSGTSLDGVDAAYVETDGERIGRLGPSLTIPYPPALRRDLRALLDAAPALHAAGRLAEDPGLLDCARRLTERHADAVAALDLKADLIGFHGQTILHRPSTHPGDRGHTWQIGDPALLARPPAARARRSCPCSTACWRDPCPSRSPSSTWAGSATSPGSERTAR